MTSSLDTKNDLDISMSSSIINQFDPYEWEDDEEEMTNAILSNEMIPLNKETLHFFNKDKNEDNSLPSQNYLSDWKLPTEDSEGTNSVVLNELFENGWPTEVETHHLTEIQRPVTSEDPTLDEEKMKILQELNPFDHYHFLYKYLSTISAVEPEKRKDIVIFPNFSDKTIIEDVASNLEEAGMDSMLGCWNSVWDNIIVPRMTSKEALKMVQLKRDYQFQQAKTAELARHIEKQSKQTGNNPSELSEDDLVYYDDENIEWPLKVTPAFENVRGARKKGKAKSESIPEPTNSNVGDAEKLNTPESPGAQLQEDHFTPGSSIVLYQKQFDETLTIQTSPSKPGSQISDHPTKRWEPTPGLEEIRKKSEEAHERFAKELDTFQEQSMVEVAKLKAGSQASGRMARD
ncbi:hypothetical protein ABW21_db0209418 [Orbilia brochopaga]|nr:hypothetical protein ABW21_db0209418 [Drechslerella brochopaga]